MKRAQEVGFPTPGEVVHFLFKMTGVLPGKHDSTPGMDDRQRKTVQKTLERLAKEEGNYHNHLGETIQQLANLVAGYVRHSAFGLAIGEVIMDALDTYNAVIQEEGTYLSRHETLRWIIEEQWVPSAAVSVAKQVTQFGLRYMADDFPDTERWYMPDIEDGKITWPLAKVMRWIYALAGTTQAQFHYPGRKADEADTERKRDLENARYWIHGRNWPPAATLDWTFRRALATRGPDDAFTPSHQEAAYIALFLARCISYAGSALLDEFGEQFLLQVCEKFKRTFDAVLLETREVEQSIQQIAQHYAMSPLQPDLRIDVVMRWCDGLRHRTHLAKARIQRLYDCGGLNDEEVDHLVEAYGGFPVRPIVEQLLGSAQRTVPADVVQALGDGLTLSEDRGLAFSRIDRYEAGMRDTKMDAVLPWMVPWLRFQVYYRQQDDANAWMWIQKAFAAARYRAGKRQYAILNHYVEMAAKQNKNGKFKDGVAWADYIGIEIRWLRDKPRSRENLDLAMSILSRARYAV